MKLPDNIKNKEVLIVYDNFEKEIADNLILQAKQIGAKVHSYNLDNYERPLETTPKEIKAHLNSVVLALVVITKQSKGDIYENRILRREFFNFKETNKDLRLGFLLDCPPNLFQEIFAYDSEELKNLNKKLFDIIGKSEVIRIETKAGTELVCKIGKLKWINQDGNITTPSIQHSILAGEVYGCPEDMNGTIIVDGVMGGPFMKYGELVDPLRLQIQDGKVISSQCKNLGLLRDFLEAMNIKNADRVGELGFGTNVALKKFYGIIGIDEKHPGVHIALGNPYPEKTGATWSSKSHIDMVLKNVNVWIDDVQVLHEGKYII